MAYSIILDLKTHVDPEISDLWIELDFVPFLGMNFWLDQEHVQLPDSMDDGAWFKVVEVDYQMKDNVFMITLFELSAFDEQQNSSGPSLN